MATSLNNLALLYETQGDYAKAEPLYKRSLAIVPRGRFARVAWPKCSPASWSSAAAAPPREPSRYRHSDLFVKARALQHGPFSVHPGRSGRARGVRRSAGHVCAPPRLRRGGHPRRAVADLRRAGLSQADVQGVFISKPACSTRGANFFGGWLPGRRSDRRGGLCTGDLRLGHAGQLRQLDLQCRSACTTGHTRDVKGSRDVCGGPRPSDCPSRQISVVGPGRARTKFCSRRPCPGMARTYRFCANRWVAALYPLCLARQRYELSAAGSPRRLV